MTYSYVYVMIMAMTFMWLEIKLAHTSIYLKNDRQYSCNVIEFQGLNIPFLTFLWVSKIIDPNVYEYLNLSQFSE